MRTNEPNLLEARGISKSFNGVGVLSNIDFTVKPGEVHALMGENGAGKSTLMKIIMGIYKSDAGSILFNDQKVEIRGARDALAIGISMIHQELSPIPEMTVAENVFVGREPCIGRTMFIDRKKLNKETGALLEEFHLNDRISPSMCMKRLSIAQIQMMEIVKAVSVGAKVIIMDEPTSSLSEGEARKLFETIALLKATGVGIVYISHRMEEVFELADRISVLRDGEMVGCVDREEATRDLIISMMVGRALSSGYPRNQTPPGEVLLEVRGATRKGMFEDVSFCVHAGEILGFSGLMGAGRSEVMRALMGYDSLDSGEVLVKGKPVKIKHPCDARQLGLALASEDRKSLGLILCRDIKENVSIQNESLFTKAGFMNHQIEKKSVREITERVRVKMNGISDVASSLSGGNQQKVVLAKCLLGDPQVLILDEPTRGIDVGAKAEIYKMMVELAQRGIGIIMVSSEMPELMGMSNRILVMAGGHIRGEFKDAASATQEDILRLALEGVS